MNVEFNNLARYFEFLFSKIFYIHASVLYVDNILIMGNQNLYS